MKICRVCFKMYDRRVPHDVLSHMHQGQGPDDKRERGR